MTRLGSFPDRAKVWLIAAGLVGMGANAPALAASCAALQSELSRLERTASRSSPAAQTWQTARQQQSKALSNARRDANYLGCASGSSAECTSLTRKIKQMTANIAKIDRQLGKVGGAPKSTSKRLRQVRAALVRQGCNRPGEGRQTPVTNDRGGPGKVFARLFGPRQDADQTAPPAAAGPVTRKQPSLRRKVPTGGTFRTLCVRTCDGFFFPVSFSTGKSQFANDAARCTEICPAAETQLFVYKNPGGDQSQMMSLAGDLYSDQPFAYRYKSEFIQECGCRLAKQSKPRSRWAEVRGSYSASGSRIRFSSINRGLPVPADWSDAGSATQEAGSPPSRLARAPLERQHLPAFQDPDTATNLEKGFDVTADLRSLRRSILFDSALEPESGKAQNLRPGDLPTLPTLPSLQSRPDRRPLAPPDQGAAEAPPVFKTKDTGFRAAPERDTAVRVVGPEFFVAQ